MSRSRRLLDLIQVLRRHHQPVAGAALAEELGVSLRTLYRDVETLRAQGAPIDGEAGVGYVLRPGFLLPSLMFSDEEIEALVLGARWVSERADQPLGKAARNVLAKINAVLPDDLKANIEATGLLIGPGDPVPVGDRKLATIREAIRSEHIIQIAYADEHGAITHHAVWPFTLAFHDRVRAVLGWCEARGGFDHFRTDRITALYVAPKRYPRRRTALLKAWRAAAASRDAADKI
ncbi:helix-turn-helix transcriptional regulator [Sphingomonas sp. MMS24-J45]|uniref:helix-turn-helix transcriptional regulator n=1 Tax=Sphingomonas sp. MMS24-J45 TaxID=3238806 RepID=UPI003850EA5F